MIIKNPSSSLLCMIIKTLTLFEIKSKSNDPAHFCEINQSGTVIGLSARGGCLVYLCCNQTHKKGETVYTVPTVTCLENPGLFLLMCKQIFAKTRFYNFLLIQFAKYDVHLKTKWKLFLLRRLNTALAFQNCNLSAIIVKTKIWSKEPKWQQPLKAAFSAQFES